MKWRSARSVVLTKTAEHAIKDNATPTAKRAPFGLPAPSSFDTRTLGHRFYIVSVRNSVETAIKWEDDSNKYLAAAPRPKGILFNSSSPDMLLKGTLLW
jgi:hypothetical protein